MRIRPATAEDIAAFSDMTNKPTMRAWVGEIDGRVVAIGGIAISQGRWVGFCDLRKEARAYKMTIARTGWRIMDEARRQGIRFVYAGVDPNEPGAVAWLTRLGFERNPLNPSLYRWRA